MTAQELKETAQRLYNAGQYQQALPLLKSATEAFPEEESLWSELVLAAHYSRQYEQAIDFAKQAIRQHPRSGWLWRQLGCELTTADRLDDAEKALNNARSLLDENDEWIWRYLAALHRKRKNLQKEIEALENLDVLGAAGSTDLYQLGIAHHNPNEFAKALEYYRRSAAMQPDIAPLFNMGLVYNYPEFSQDADAADAYRRALALKIDGIKYPSEKGDSASAHSTSPDAAARDAQMTESALYHLLAAVMRTIPRELTGLALTIAKSTRSASGRVSQPAKTMGMLLSMVAAQKGSAGMGDGMRAVMDAQLADMTKPNELARMSLVMAKLEAQYPEVPMFHIYRKALEAKGLELMGKPLVHPDSDSAKEKLESTKRKLVPLAERARTASILFPSEDMFRFYVNPFEVLNIQAIESDDGLDVKVVQRAKKRLLQELELNDGKISWLHDYPLDKSRAIAMEDELYDESKRRYHRAIFHNKQLLRFLTLGDIEHFLYSDAYFPQETIELLDEDPGFMSFIGKPFAQQYNLILTYAMKLKCLPVIEVLFDGRRWVKPEHDAICFDGASRWVKQNGEWIEQQVSMAYGPKTRPDLSATLAGRILGAMDGLQ